MNNHLPDQEGIEALVRKISLLEAKMQLLLNQGQYESSVALFRNELVPTFGTIYETMKKLTGPTLAIAAKEQLLGNYPFVLLCFRTLGDYDGGLVACAEAEKLISELKQAGNRALNPALLK